MFADELGNPAGSLAGGAEPGHDSPIKLGGSGGSSPTDTNPLTSNPAGAAAGSGVGFSGPATSGDNSSFISAAPMTSPSSGSVTSVAAPPAEDNGSGTGGSTPIGSVGGGQYSDNGGGNGKVGGPTLTGEPTDTGVRFVANEGQWDPSVQFATQGNGYQAWLTGNSAVLALTRSASDGEIMTDGTQAKAGDIVNDVLDIDWTGINPEVQATGTGQLDSTSNFFWSNDPAKQATNVSEYSGVQYANAWTGIDLVYHRSDTGGLEYDLDVNPGADPSAVGFRIDGAQASIDPRGNLVLTTPDGNQLVENAPSLYQIADDGTHQAVAGGYQIRQDGSIGFSVGQYDTHRELVVDPTLSYATTFGGSAIFGSSVATGVQTDALGNADIAGYTTSPDLPATTGAYDTTANGDRDAFAAKFDSSGSLVWSTYIGGSSTDEADGLALGPDGNLFIAGSTNSSNYPTTGGAFQTTPGGTLLAQQDAFLTKLSSDGTALVYSTRLGGNGQEFGHSVAVDQQTGEAVVVGSTAILSSNTFPTQNAYQGTMSGGQDAFVTRFNSAGSGLVFSTYLGGTGTEAANGVAIDSAGDEYVVGQTNSSDFPAVGGYDQKLSGFSDGFLAQYTAAGSLRSATLMGGTDNDSATAVAVDSEGHAYLTVDGLVEEYESPGSAPVFTTSLGGTDFGRGIAVDQDARAVVVGTDGTNLTVTRLAADGGSVDWSTTWWPTMSAAGYAAAVDQDGNIYAAGDAGSYAALVKYGPPDAPVITGMTTDSGASNSDLVTNDTTPTLSGTAVSGSTVTLYQKGPRNSAPVVIGTTTATGGTWSITAPTEPVDGPYVFTATATAGGDTSTFSAPLTVTLDTVAPAVTLAVATQTYDVEPIVITTATDPAPSGGLASPTTATLDVDLNNDGDFADPGEMGYATTTLSGGVGGFSGYTPLTPGTIVRYRVRVTDLAGNEGTSPVKSIQIFSSSGGWTAADGTAGTRSDYGGMYGWSSVISGMLDAGNVTASQQLNLSVSPTKCGCQNPYLYYNSQEANPSPVVQAVVQSSNTLPLPSHVYGTLTWDGVAGSTINYSLSGLSPGGQWLFSAAPTSSPTTGRHTYTLSLFIDYDGTTNDQLLSVTGYTFVVNRSDSPYGVGWSFSNTDALVTIAADGTYPAGMLRLFGKGGWAFYQSSGGSTYTSPAGDGGTLVATGSGWKYTSPKGGSSNYALKLVFDTSGRMTTWTNVTDHETVTYTYAGGSGTTAQVSTMKGADGSLVTFSYSSSLLNTVAALGSRVVTVTHSSGDLTEITNPDGKTHDFTYDGNHRLICDSTATAKVSYAYDSFGLVSGMTQGADPIFGGGARGGLSGGMTAGPNGSIPATYTDALGFTWTTWYDRAGQVVQTLDPDGALETFERDSNEFVVKSTDALGRVTTYAVDSAGDILGETRPDGTMATWAYGGANDSLTSYQDFNGGLSTYTNDSDGNQLTATDPLNHTTSYSYNDGLLETMTDPVGNVTTYLYDAERRLIGALVGGAVTGTVGYDGAGNPNTLTDPLGNVTTTVYDAAGRPVTVTDALGETTTYAYDAGGLLLSMTDALGHVTSYAYDSTGMQTTEIDAYGTGLARTITTVYDAAEQPIAVVDALGNRTTVVYDGAGNVIATVDALGNRTTDTYDLAGELTATEDPLGRVTQFGYDQLGRLVSTTDPLGNTTTTVYDANSNVVATIDPLGHQTTAVYDAANRLIATVDAAGDRTSYGYDNADRLVTMTDPRGNVTTTEYDARGRVSDTIDALGHRVTYGYDAADNLVSVTDANNHTTSTVYDALNRAVASVDALGNRTTAVFDAVGNMTASVDPLNHRTTTVFDELDRPVATVDALNNRWTSVYDAADEMTASVDPLGNRTTEVYDADGNVIAVVDALGNRTTDTYDAAGQLVSTTDALNHVTSYGYDGAGRQVTTTDALGNTWTTGYDAAGRAVSMTDPNNHTQTTVYDNADRVIATVDGAGDRTSYGYDAASNVVSVTDANNHTTTTEYDALNRATDTIDPLNHRSTVVYDAVGNTIATVDALNHRTTTGYDAADRAVTTTDALGHVWTTAYDAASNVVSTTDPLNHTTSDGYDSLNRVATTTDANNHTTSYSYDAAGNLKTVTDALNRVTTYGYDARNMQVTTTDALGNVWTTQYDALGRAWRSIDPLGRDNRTYFDAAGQVVETADGLGYRTDTVYDAAGNVIATVDPAGDRTSYGYDAADRQITMTNPLGNVTTTSYDAVGNVTATVSPLGNTTTAVYDELNRQIATVDALGERSTVVYDAVGNVQATVDALNRITTYGYDALNRQVTVTDPLGGIATTTYDAAGNVATTVDQLNHTTSYAYDAANQLVTTTDALGHVWTTGYDAVGNVVAQTDANNHTTTTVFDAVNQPIATVDALGNRSTSVYDAAGQMIASVDPLNHRTTYGYDSRGLLITVTDPLNHVSTTTYDSVGRAIAQTDPLNHTTTTVYDAASQVVASVDPLGYRTTSVYDADGNQTVLIDASGNRTTWTYDALDRQASETDPLNHTSTVAYDAAGQLVSATDRDGRRIDYAYDNDGRLSTEKWFASGGSQTQTQTWTYDAAGEMLTAQDPDGTYTMAYDALGRTTSVAEPFGLSMTFGYDAVGNRTSVQDSKGGVTTVSFDADNRQLSEQVGGTGVSAMRFDYAYDAAGRTTSSDAVLEPGGHECGGHDGVLLRQCRPRDEHQEHIGHGRAGQLHLHV